MSHWNQVRPLLGFEKWENSRMESEIKAKLVHQSAAQHSPAPPEQTSKLGMKHIKAKPEPGIRTKQCFRSVR